MWNQLSSIGQGVSQFTKVVGAQLLEGADKRIDAADFSDGDNAACSEDDTGQELVRRVVRLQDKLHRARDEIDRLNDLRSRATEAVNKSLGDKNEELAEMETLLQETRNIVSSSLSPRSPSPSGASSQSDQELDHHAGIQAKIKSSERMSLLTRRLHAEKRSHIAAIYQIKNENAELKGQVRSMQSQLSSNGDRVVELEGIVDRQREELESNEMLIARLRSNESSSTSELDNARSVQIQLVQVSNERDHFREALESERHQLEQAKVELAQREKEVDSCRDRIGDLTEQIDKGISPERSSPSDADAMTSFRQRVRQQFQLMKEKNGSLQDEIDTMKRQSDEHGVVQRQLEESLIKLKTICSALSLSDDDVIAADIVAAIDQLRSSSSPTPSSTTTPSSAAQLLISLADLLGVVEDADLVIAAVQRLANERTTSTAQAISITTAYEESQETIDDLTRKKNALKADRDGLMKRISDLQGECRRTIADDNDKRVVIDQLKEQIVVLQSRQSHLGRMNELELHLQRLQKEIGEKDAVIRNLNVTLEERVKKLVEVQALQDRWLEEAKRDHAEYTLDRERLQEQLRSVSSEHDVQVEALQEQIRRERESHQQVALDLAASKHLVKDNARLQEEVATRTTDCMQLEEALDNLRGVLDEMREESATRLNEARRELEQSSEMAEDGNLALVELREVSAALREAEDTIVQLEAKLSSSRKYALQVETDNASLRHAMQQTMDRIKTFSSDENLIDRRIVNKLLVTYLEKKASQEVLSLMIRMLSFTDEQKRLVLESQRPKGLIGAFSSLIPSPYPAEDDYDDEQPQPENLADLWVNFLLKETGSRKSSRITSPSTSTPDAIITDQATTTAGADDAVA